ncbi:MAG TPA: hypothetical protein VK735_40075 [Pseudonocardia sp.]|uniref:hypothetical protein n=1 Tax=Pseudonocardia sp. TaxID=60912 RepID=UPI002BD495CD|nr:hypothetical protein [Pseudonocardia sp.]HTF53683.1 hypothetical protein [Pseudonocardia sp.]
MKLKVTMTLDVDADAWRREYGISSGETETDILLHLPDDIVEQVNERADQLGTFKVERWCAHTPTQKRKGESAPATEGA